MISNVPTDKMQKTGLVLSWLAGAAVVGMLIFLGLFIRSITTPGPQTYSPWIHFFNGTPYLGFVTLAGEALALALFVVGVACWRLRILRSWRWVLSALGVGFVAILILVTIYLAVVVTLVVIGGPNV